ncbi:whirlin-like [Lingula anatina]|uniref:Whirlin-like n=1 Tax=Lingula anatina TaxID=7574 RepID=A0A1S3KCX0_LINAN|nr:whirlin-like [Lingula anatina]|eukprot:XP_013420096.1 whirlin-like [Lingula anatina]
MSSIEYEMTYLRSPSPVRIPPQRTLSVNVRRLQEAVNTLLEEEDRSDFIEALNVYHSKRNVYDFVQALKLIFDNSVKRQIIPLLRKVMPHSDQDAFDQYMYNDPITSIPLNTPYLNQHGLRRTSSVPSQQPFSLRRTKSSEIIRRPSEPPKSKIYRQVNNTFDVEKSENNVVNNVTLKKNSSHEGWGLSIRGGAEHGIGIYVSQVEPGSLADRQGLCTGDQILSANQVNFSDITHEEAAKVRKVYE